jgi:transcriptional regulator with XRE-family HTH domain
MPENLDTFSKRFRWAVQRKGWKPADVVRETGISKQTISNYWNKPNTEPTLERLYLVADALNLNPRWLAIGEGEPWLSKDYNHLLASLPPQDREHAEAVLRAMEERASYSRD